MNEANPAYELTAQQCTSKMSGLKRTYKNIVDQNKKSGNSRHSWPFFSVCFITHIYVYTHTHTHILFIVYDIHRYATRYICIFNILSLFCNMLWIHYLPTKRPFCLLQLLQVMVHRIQIRKDRRYQYFLPLNRKVSFCTCVLVDNNNSE